MLKIVTATAKAPRKSTPMPTSPQQQARAHTATCGQSWPQLSIEGRQSFNALGQKWTPPTESGKPRVKTTSTGIAVYHALNTQRLQMGLPLLSVAPSMPEAVSQIEAFTVSAFRTGSQSGPFVLNIESTAYTGKIKVLATPALSPGITKINPNHLRQIAILDGLTDGITSLANQYAAYFRAPSAGMQVAISLVPVTDTGFKGVRRLATAVVLVSNDGASSPLTLDDSV